MKIYINNFNLDLLNEIAEQFKNNLINTESYVKLYTNEGIYRIENKNIYMLDTIDKDIKKYNNYYNYYTLIVDSSYFRKNIVSCIHGDKHLSFQTKKNIYKINKNSSVQMIIKYIYKNERIIPNDIYFELNIDIDINDNFIKKEIIEFLSLLT